MITIFLFVEGLSVPRSRTDTYGDKAFFIALECAAFLTMDRSLSTPCPHESVEDTLFRKALMKHILAFFLLPLAHFFYFLNYIAKLHI